LIISSKNSRLDLKLRHPSQSLDRVVKSLDFCPDVSWNIGEQWRTPRGTTRDELRKDSYWCVGLWSEEEREASELLSLSIEQVVSRLQLGDDFFLSGGCISLDLFVEYSEACGDVFGPKLLGLLSEHRVELGFEVGPKQVGFRTGICLK
jgi:hypothetical protein